MNNSSINRLLLIEDDPAFAALLRDMFKADGVDPIQMMNIGCMREAETYLSENEVDIILLDLSLPDARGLEAVRRAHAAAPRVPLVVLAEQDDDSLAEAMHEGAQDYLFKGEIEPRGLMRALRYAVERKALQTELFETNERAQVTLNSIGDAVACTDSSGRITFLNRAAETLTGWSLQEAIGRLAAEVISLRNQPRAGEPRSTGWDGSDGREESLESTSVLVRRDGIEVPIEESLAPIHDDEGLQNGSVLVFRDVSAARWMNMQMLHSTQHDLLTGLPNRFLLNDRITQAIASASRSGRNMAILFLDLDGFKHINDSLGHLTGDKLLQSVAARLTATVRPSDTVSRQGGDEFVILLADGGTWNGAAATATRVLAAIAEPHSIDGTNLHITTSIGIRVFEDEETDAETLIMNADAAMYYAKGKGRQSFQHFKPVMSVRAVERHTIEAGLHGALGNDEFAIHYQPKMHLASGLITGAEALVRWNGPSGDPVSPATFIPVAEDSGLIVPIGRWVLRAACTQWQRWISEGLAVGTLAVNVSALELQNDGFLDGLRTILQDTGLDPERLEIELTESALIGTTSETVAMLASIKDMGVSIAIDDFGTGYSSLRYLRQFPVDTLKIDQSFVGQITDKEQSTIVTAVISVAHGLGLNVVAEGVETTAQLKFLQDHRCDQGQGYHFSRPMPAESFVLLPCVSSV
ncbi:MAG TPA: EAL domain-containing protein [Actinomycetota bacterium]|nr:EAL domain-containing protein [Actinomycetota bacterium]